MTEGSKIRGKRQVDYLVLQRSTDQMGQGMQKGPLSKAGYWLTLPAAPSDHGPLPLGATGHA